MEILVNGIRMHYEIRGKGQKVVLLIHGNGEDWHCFDRQIPDFAKEYTVIAVDSRGHGQSEWGNRPFCLVQIAEDYLALLEKLDLQNVNIIGFSDGANIAILMALADIRRIGKLVLAGGNLYPSGVEFWCQGPTVLQYLGLSVLSHFQKEYYRKKQIIGLMVKEPHIRPEKLRSIGVPTLVLAGSRDVIRRSHTRLIYQSLPDAELTLVPQTGHFIFRDAPEVVNKRILEFFSIR